MLALMRKYSDTPMDFADASLARHLKRWINGGSSRRTATSTSTARSKDRPSRSSPDAQEDTRVSRSITVSESTYSALEAAAAAEGTTPDWWLEVHLPDLLPPGEPFVTADPAQPRNADSSEADEPKSLLDLLIRAGGVGGFRSGRSDLSERHSELFAEGMLEKRRMGTL